MEWFVFALLSPFLFAVCNVIDKYILSKKIKDPISFNIILLTLNIIPLIILTPFLNLAFNFSSFLAVLYGVIFTGLYIIYNEALMKEETSRIVSLMYTFPIFVIILSIIFLQEHLGLQNYYVKYLGVIFLVISAILVSYKDSKKKFHFSSAVALILFYSFGTASMKVLTKYALFDIDFWSFFIWSIIGNLIGVFILVIIPKIRKNLRKHISSIDRKTWLIILIEDIFIWIAYLLLFVATSLGFVSLVTALMSIQPFLVFLIIIFLTVHKPKILKEEISKLSLILKLIAVILIFIGSYLIIMV